MEPSLLILAGGLGSRYGGLKQVDGFGPNKEAILDYSIFDAMRAGFKKFIILTTEELIEYFEKKYVRIFKKNNLIGYILKYIKFVCTNISSFEIYFS